MPGSHVVSRRGASATSKRGSALHVCGRESSSRAVTAVARQRTATRVTAAGTMWRVEALQKKRVGVAVSAVVVAGAAVNPAPARVGIGGGCNALVSGGSRASASVVCRAAASGASSASTFDTTKVRIGEEGVIINVYAESLLMAANEAGGSVLEKVASDMDVLEMAVSAPEFVDYLKNPIVDLKAKVTTIKESAKDLGWHEFTVNVLELLLTKNREWVIPDLPYAFKQLYNAMSKTMRVEVLSPVKLSNEQTFKVVSLVQKKTGASNVKCKNVVDPSIEGGLIIKYGEDLDSMIDLTLQRDVGLMRRTFDKDLSKAYIESITELIEEEYPDIVTPAFSETVEDISDFASNAKKNSGTNDKFVDSLDTAEKDDWLDLIRIA